METYRYVLTSLLKYLHLIQTYSQIQGLQKIKTLILIIFILY